MIYLITVSLLWAFSFGLVKTGLSGLDPHFLAFGRILCAFPLFLPFLSTKSLNRSLIIHLLFIGAMQYGICYLAYLFAFQYLDSHQVALFAIMMPLYIVFINAIYEQKFPKYSLFMAGLAVIGAGIIKYDGMSFQNLLTGFICMQIANISFALGEIQYRRLRHKNPQLVDREIYAVVFTGALIITAIATTIDGDWSTLAIMSPKQVIILAFLGTLSTGLGFFWWNKGAVVSKIATLAVFHNIKVPLAIIASLIIFSEQTDYTRLILGGIVMLIAVYLSQKGFSSLTPNLSRKKEQPVNP